MKKKLVPVADLKLGMYVAELDRPWLGTPFPFQGFSLIEARQIEELGTYCRAVFVDVERGQADARAPQGAGAAAGVVRGSTQYPLNVGVEQEFATAKKVYEGCASAIERTLERLRGTGGIDAAALKSAVHDLAESVIRNPDAMTLLVKLQHKGDVEFIRALDTSILAITFARFLQFARDDLETLGLAGMLLDVGKVRIPDAILRKPALLSPEEYELAKQHVRYSSEIVREANGVPERVAEIVRMHHEREDGSGYPDGLKGAEIPLHGAIAGLIDSYSAMVSVRPYAEQLSPSNALGKLFRQRGTLFQEALVEQLIQCIGIYPVGSVVELNTGEIAIVISQNIVRRLQPRVMVVLDRGRAPVRPHKILDLIKNPRATPDEPYRIRRTMPPESVPIDLREYFLQEQLFGR